MKKVLSILLVVTVIFSLSACGKSDTQEKLKSSEQTKEQTGEQIAKETETNESKQPKQDDTKKMLVAYFSWADNAVQDDIDAMTSPSVTSPGNVAQLASWVKEETRGDLFSIQVKKPYPSD